MPGHRIRGNETLSRRAAAAARRALTTKPLPQRKPCKSWPKCACILQGYIDDIGDCGPPLRAPNAAERQRTRNALAKAHKPCPSCGAEFADATPMPGGPAKRTRAQWREAMRLDIAGPPPPIKIVVHSHRDGDDRPWQFTVGGYDVREGTDGKVGIYLRDYNVRVATFNDNSSNIQDALRRMFDAAHVMLHGMRALPKLRSGPATADARGWYTCDCGQWVNDKLAPCTVCKQKRRKRK